MNNTHEELVKRAGNYFTDAESYDPYAQRIISDLLTRNAELEKTVEGLMQNTASQKQTFDALAKKYVELEAEAERWHSAYEMAHEQAVENGQSFAQMRFENKRLKEAMKPFSEYGDVLCGQKVRGDSVVIELWEHKITVDDFRKIATRNISEPTPPKEQTR